MIPGIVSAFYLFGSGYTYGVSLRGYGQKFTISTCRWTLGDDFRIVSVFSAQLGSTADTCGASVYEAFRKNFNVLHAKWFPGDDFMFVSVFSAELGSTVDT